MDAWEAAIPSTHPSYSRPSCNQNPALHLPPELVSGWEGSSRFLLCSLGLQTRNQTLRKDTRASTASHSTTQGGH